MTPDLGCATCRHRKSSSVESVQELGRQGGRGRRPLEARPSRSRWRPRRSRSAHVRSVGRGIGSPATEAGARFGSVRYSPTEQVVEVKDGGKPRCLGGGAQRRASGRVRLGSWSGLVQDLSRFLPAQSDDGLSTVIVVQEANGGPVASPWRRRNRPTEIVTFEEAGLSADRPAIPRAGGAVQRPEPRFSDRPTMTFSLLKPARARGRTKVIWRLTMLRTISTSNGVSWTLANVGLGRDYPNLNNGSRQRSRFPLRRPLRRSSIFSSRRTQSAPRALRPHGGSQGLWRDYAIDGLAGSRPSFPSIAALQKCRSTVSRNAPRWPAARAPGRSTPRAD